MRNLFILGSLLAVAVGSGCGADNVASCQSYVDSLSCGDYDFSAIYSDSFCDAYADLNCDIADYFTCLEDNTVCDEATSTIDQTGTVDCAALATCD